GRRIVRELRWSAAAHKAATASLSRSARLERHARQPSFLRRGARRGPPAPRGSLHSPSPGRGREERERKAIERDRHLGAASVGDRRFVVGTAGGGGPRPGGRPDGVARGWAGCGGGGGGGGGGCGRCCC